VSVVANYSKTRLGNDQIEGLLSLSPRGKRILYLLLGLALAAGLGIGIWSAVASDPLATSANGCISVNESSSTGGAVYHACGAQAKTFCRAAFAHSDAVSLAGRTQCNLAGLTKAKVG
jgi:hypothetical protein